MSTRTKSKSPVRKSEQPPPPPRHEPAFPAAFLLPAIADNPCGWGPPPNAASMPAFAALDDVPYAPFSRFDKIGKVVDWSAPVQADDLQKSNAPGSRRSGPGNINNAPETVGSGTASAFAFAFSNNELLDEASFSVVDRVPLATLNSFGATGFGGTAFGNGGTGGVGGVGVRKLNRRGGGVGSVYSGITGRGGKTAGSNNTRGGYSRRGGMSGSSGGQNSGGGGGRFNEKVPRLRDSVNVGHDWVIKEEIEFSRLGKLYFEVEDAEDLSVHGKAQFYNKQIDRINTKTEKRLLPNIAATTQTTLNPTASADPMLKSYMSSIEGRVVVASADVIAAIMCCGKSVYGWDLVFTKKGGKIVIDKRDGGYFDLFTVNENATEPPVETENDNLNTPTLLAQESTQILHNFAAQALRPLAEQEPYILKQESPFITLAESLGTGLPVASGIQRYRKWDLGGDISLVVRTTVDAVIEGTNPEGMDEIFDNECLQSPVDENAILFTNVRSLNEFDSRAGGSGGAPDWRAKVDQQRGAVMVSEIKNNGFKLIRWTLESILSGAHLMKIGFVSRSNPKDRTKHGILGAMTVKPAEFITQMNYSIGAGWGILRAIVDLIYGFDNEERQEEGGGDGKYVIVKDANKQILRVYRVPGDFGVGVGVAAGASD